MNAAKWSYYVWSIYINTFSIAFILLPCGIAVSGIVAGDAAQIVFGIYFATIFSWQLVVIRRSAIRYLRRSIQLQARHIK